MLDFINKLFPPRSRFAVLLTVATNFIIYYGALLLNKGRTFHTTDISLDYLIPLIPFTVFIYFGAFVQWAVSYFHLAQTEKDFCFTFCSALIISKLLCFLFFIIYPTQVSEIPKVVGNSFSDICTRFLYKIDGPSTNLFPSVHCLESWYCLRIAFSSNRSNKAYKIISVIVSLLVFVSVVTTKQHYLIDIPAGILAAEIGIFIAKKLKISRIFFAVDKKMFAKKEIGGKTE